MDVKTMRNEIPPRLQELLKNKKISDIKEMPIPIGKYDEGCGIDCETAQKHIKLCLGAKIPCVTISNAIPSTGIIHNPTTDGFKTPASFVRADISWFFEDCGAARKYFVLLSERLAEFHKMFGYMLVHKKILDEVKRYTYNGKGKYYAAVQWCYGGIYAKLLYILLLHFMETVQLPDAELRLNESISKIVTVSKKRERPLKNDLLSNW